MKRVLFLMLVSLVMIAGRAQDIQFMFGEQSKVFFETTAVEDNRTTFAYMEAAYEGGAMLKLFREQKFWELPLYIHAEYQTTFAEHTAIIGAAYTINHNRGYLSLAPLFRYDNKAAAQLSISYLLVWKWGDFNGYNHLWYNGNYNFVGEERLNINVTDKIAVSGIIDITHFGAWAITPYCGIRYRL